jgi:alpha 1,3-glucosidase
MMQVFPSDEQTYAMDDQFMLGAAFLVKPVTEKGQESIPVYLPPSSNWYDYDTFETVKGVAFNVNTPLHKVPVFLRGGQIVPRKERIRRSSLLTVHDPFTLLVALDETVSSSF